VIQRGGKFGTAAVSRGWQRAHDHTTTGRKVRVPNSHQMAQLPGHPVTGHRVADPAADDETHPGLRHTGLNVYDQRPVPTPLSAAHHGVEVGPAAQSNRRGQH